MPFDDDDPEVGGGPPPDPSLRQWRHPSEIAAASAAAARDADNTSPRRERPALVSALTVGVAATILVGVGAAVVASIVVGGESLTSAGDGQHAVTGVVGVGSNSLQASSFRSTSTSTTAGTDLFVNSSTTGVATTAGSTSVPATTEPARLLRADGVYRADSAEIVQSMAAGEPLADDAPEPGRLGSFVAVGDLMVTSASAVDGSDHLVLLSEGRWWPVAVLGVDHLTDVAVLMPTAEALPGSGASDLGPGAADGNVQLSPGMMFSLATAGVDQTTEALITGPKDRVTTRSNHVVYGAWLTGAPAPEGSAGAGVVSDDGQLLGFVVDSDDHLASIIPIETAYAIATHLLQWGVPAPEWLGLHGVRHKSGGVFVTAVEPDGPANHADLRPGDVVLEIDNMTIVEMEHLAHLVRELGVGTQVVATYEREGKRDWTVVTIGVWPGVSPENG